MSSIPANVESSLIEATKQTIVLLFPFNRSQYADEACSLWSQDPTDAQKSDKVLDQLRNRLASRHYRGSEYASKNPPDVLDTHVDKIENAMTALQTGDADTCQSELSGISWNDSRAWVSGNKNFHSTTESNSAVESNQEP